MGWNFRRSMSIGKLLRINLSKSGMGFSFGLPGFRISFGPDKKVRRTISIPGTGLYNTRVISNTPQQNVLICPACGTKITMKANYCMKCGLKVR